MQDVFAIAAPVFGLIIFGVVIGRAHYLSDGAGKVLAEFGFKVAMPALLFKGASSVAALPVSPLALILVYFASSALVWILATLATGALLGRPATDGAVVAD